VHFDGCAWQGQRLLDAPSSAAMFASMDFETFVRTVSGCNGLFRVVVQRPGELLAAVDRIRSHPLFYGLKDGRAFLSHDAYWVRRQVGDAAPQDASAAELWHMLYVLGDRTLAAGVKQLPPGCALHVRLTPMGPVVSRVHYFTYVQRTTDLRDTGRLMESMDEILDRAFRRAIDSAQGRQFVVPLSGGLDSRLVTCMLKRLGVSDVLCFSYGLPGNVESVESEKAARQMGFPWEFVSYRDIPWRDPQQCRLRREFIRFSSNLLTLPPLLEDFLAVGVLLRRDRIRRGAIFCPGHSAGFTSGLRGLQAAARTTDEETLARELVHHHCLRLRWGGVSRDVRSQLHQQIVETLRHLRAQSQGNWDGPMLMESWSWMERQCKRIINMIRVYEFWGCSWRLPLYDCELIDFWKSIPSELRAGKNLYEHYLLSRSRDRFFGMYDHLVQRPGAFEMFRGLLGRAAKRVPLTRYFASEDNFERLLCGSYGRYLRSIGRRALSLEPVTAPWLLLEQGGLEEIWSADASESSAVKIEAA
jgi:asparagine synthase (glutamine-hydrolysing)